MEPASVERKLTAILTADVKGYSRLMGEDEVATIRTLTTYRELIASLIQQHRGRVIDTVGDNLLAEFGSVVDAVTCAVEVQRELARRNAELPDHRKMEFRIGINLGDVVVERERIYGDGVNIAARLEALAEGGGICISGTVFDSIGNKLKLEYDYLGEQKVKNIVQPVRAYRVLSVPGTAAHRVIQAKRAVARVWGKGALAIAAVVLMGVGVALVWNFYGSSSLEPASVERMAFPLPDKPSIAVLPFANISDDPKQEYFADGMTDDLITDLSKVSGLFIIARNSTFTYKGKPVKIRQVAEELGVRYILEGSVRRVGDQVRINAQLIDALTGGHLWAERYDRNLRDIFALQDEVVEKVVSALAVKLESGEQKRLRRKHALSPESYDLFLHARTMLSMYAISSDRLLKARELFERVIEQAPSFPGGYAGLSETYSITVLHGYSRSPLEEANEAFKWAQKAWEIDEQFGMAKAAMANAFQITGHPDKAIATLENMLISEASNAEAHAQLGRFLMWAGRAGEAIDPINTAIRLNPEFGSPYLNYLGLVYFTLGKYEAVISAFEKNTARGGPIDDAGLAVWAAAYNELGRSEEAATVANRLFDNYPGFHLRSFWLLRLYVKPEDGKRLTDIFKRADLPEDRPYTR